LAALSRAENTAVRFLAFGARRAAFISLLTANALMAFLAVLALSLRAFLIADLSIGMFGILT